jgi:hypothetical protein
MVNEKKYWSRTGVEFWFEHDFYYLNKRERNESRYLVIDAIPFRWCGVRERFVCVLAYL